MKSSLLAFCLTAFLQITMCLAAIADENALDYLYSPDLDEARHILQNRIVIAARNADFSSAVDLSQTLLDSAEPMQIENPAEYGQVLINHGIVQSAAGNDELALSIVTRGLEIMEQDMNPFDETLINGLMVKGLTELASERLNEARETFRRAQHILHREKGVYNEEQLVAINYLTATYLRQADPLAADRQQMFSLRIAEQTYGPQSLEILPLLGRLGRYFASRGSTIPVMVPSEIRVQRDILFKRAISMYNRSINIIETNYGSEDARLIGPLRGLANARMLQTTNRRHAEDALLRALMIVESNPDATPFAKATALTDIGDLYIITSNAEAADYYRRAWELLNASEETQGLAERMFGSPTRLFPSSFRTPYLTRTPDRAAPGDPLFAELEFVVTTMGRVKEVRVLDKNVPNENVRALRERVSNARYRPRIEDGEVMVTEGMFLRQPFAVTNQAVYADAVSTESEADVLNAPPT